MKNYFTLGKNLEINISDSAYKELKNMLFVNKDDYSCIKFDYKKSCCKLPPVEIYLDTLENKDDYTAEKFKDIYFICTKNILNNIKKIELIYENSTFMIKATPKALDSSNDHNCTTCHGCNNDCNK